MTIGNISNPISAAVLNELAESSLEIAQQSQQSVLMADKGLEQLSKGIKTSTDLVVLDAPDVDENSLDFFSTMIIALSRLSGILGDMADSTIVELQFKRDEIKELLKDKLETIQDQEKRRKDRITMEKKLEDHKSRTGVFGSVLNFVFAAAEIIGGTFVVAAGVVSANPALIAGGSSLIIAGVLEAAAEIVSLTSGNDETAEKMKTAAQVFMYAGLALSTFGAMSVAGAAKQPLKKVQRRHLKKVAKERQNK